MSSRQFGYDNLSAAQWEQRAKNNYEFHDEEWDALSKKHKREYVELTKIHCRQLEEQYAEIMALKEQILDGA